MLHCQYDSFLDPSCNFHSFVHDFSQCPSSTSHGSVQYCHHDSSPSLSCNFRGFGCTVSTTLPDPSCNFRDFVHFSPDLSCSCHGFVLHCQHSSSLNLLDNPPLFCQLSFDCLPPSTTPRILQALTLILSSRVHTF